MATATKKRKPTLAQVRRWAAIWREMKKDQRLDQFIQDETEIERRLLGQARIRHYYMGKETDTAEAYYALFYARLTAYERRQEREQLSF